MQARGSTTCLFCAWLAFCKTGFLNLGNYKTYGFQYPEFLSQNLTALKLPRLKNTAIDTIKEGTKNKTSLSMLSLSVNNDNLRGGFILCFLDDGCGMSPCKYYFFEHECGVMVSESYLVCGPMGNGKERSKFCSQFSHNSDWTCWLRHGF